MIINYVNLHNYKTIKILRQMLLLFALIFLLNNVNSKEIILSSGIGGWSYDELWSEYTAYKSYAEMNIITTSSILAYYIQENGTLGVYTTHYPEWNGEQYQSFIKENLKLKALPCLYCDATIGACSNLSYRLNNLYENMDEFINETIRRAKMYGWEGYSVDLEPDDEVDTTNVTHFILKWARALHDNDMYLSVWIGGDTPYNLTQLYNSSIIQLITMDTYGQQYEQVIDTLAPIQISMIESSHLGFGLLADFDPGELSDDINIDIQDIVEWSILANIDSISVWASHIYPEWYSSLHYFIK